MFQKKESIPEKMKESLTADLKQAFGGNLLSAVLYGPNNRNVLTVLKSDALEVLTNVPPLEKKWSKSGVEFTFFVTQPFVRDSADVFPLEFLEIKQAHSLLCGEDFFKDLSIRRGDLRLQCERELRGKLLHLRREYARYQGSRRALSELLQISSKQFMIVFRGLVAAAGNDGPSETAAALVAQMEKALSLSLPTLSRIVNDKTPGDLTGLRVLFHAYAAEIQSIFEVLDKLKTSSTSEAL